MGDTIEIILKYLRKNHFIKAEAALKEEVSTHQNVEGVFSPVKDDLDGKLVQHLCSLQEAASTFGFVPHIPSSQQARDTLEHYEVLQKWEQVPENQGMDNGAIVACATGCQVGSLNEKSLFHSSQVQYLWSQCLAAGTEEATMQLLGKHALMNYCADMNEMQDSVQPEDYGSVATQEKNPHPSMKHLLRKEKVRCFPEGESTEARDNGEQYQFHETKFVQEKETILSKRLQNPSKGVSVAGITTKESSWVGTSDRGYAENGFSSNLTMQSTWKDSFNHCFLNSPSKPSVYDEEHHLSGQIIQNDNVTNGTLDFFQDRTSLNQKDLSKGFQVEIGKSKSEDSVHENNLFEPSTEELPRLPPVRLHSQDKHLDSSKEGSGAGNSTSSFESAFRSLGSTPEGACGLNAFFEHPLGQDLPFSGTRRLSIRPSVSQGIVEDCASGFAMPVDGLSESRDFIDDCWDSDAYEDEDDPGYLRQPIEDEAWFLAHEIDYPSEDERARKCAGKNSKSFDDLQKFEDDEHSFVEEESYFSGEEYCKSKHDTLTRRDQVRYDDLYDKFDKNDTSVSKGPGTSNLMSSEKINLVDTELSWKGFVSQKHGSEYVEQAYSDYEKPELTCSLVLNVDCDSEECSNVGVTRNTSQINSALTGILVVGSDERDTGVICEEELALCGSAPITHYQRQIPLEEVECVESRHVEAKNAPVWHLDDEDDDHDMILQFYNETWSHKKHSVEREVPNRNSLKQLAAQNQNEFSRSNGHGDCMNKAEEDNGGLGFGAFSFPSPSSAGEFIVSKAGSIKLPWPTNDGTVFDEEGGEYFNSVIGPDDTLAAWKRKSNESSPIFSSRDEYLLALNLSNQSAASVHSTDDYVSIEAREGTEGNETGQVESTDAVVADDEDAATISEQIRKLGAEEDEFEVFDLRIIHRKNRTGFEEEKEFPVVINSLIAGRYHVTEYLGSAAFSKAIQAHDLHTGIDVCMKVIKNNKDFFDQSLDEIKLLKFVNKHDPADKYHVLRLYDYFYHREHLFIVCELLRANLYEFQKFNKESGGEVYFTMPRLQLIARQCLEALEFLHGLGLIHCDLKPENILVKSYSRCEIKVIDLGSSCFQTDHLCSYVQSRSYRAPEVILGLPYDQKIDIWSLGCILAELCSGNVLFQNCSLATLLARVIGILGPVDPDLLANGRDTYKFFTKNHMLYERNQESEQFEYLLPKKTSLSYRLPMGDQGFIEFVQYLLQINAAHRPTATEALQHPWLSYPYEPVSS